MAPEGGEKRGERQELAPARRLGAPPPAAPAGLCRLALLAGQGEACPLNACPFWEEGGAVVDAGCLWARLPVAVSPGHDLQLLIELRDGARSAAALRLLGRLQARAEA